MSDTPITAALFPIPNLVAFPGTVVPLHVFEPRYRRLVNDCVAEDRMVGICHTRKTIRPAPARQSLEQALSTNQASYQPQEIFTAGPCEILETTDDGRILAQVHMRQRLRIHEEQQAVPYRIVSCLPVEDEPFGPTTEDAALKDSINQRLIELTEDKNAELAEQLRDPTWLELAPDEFSFSVFRYLRFDADLMQFVLETRTANERLKTIWSLLSQG